MGLYSTVQQPCLTLQESAEIDSMLDEAFDPAQGFVHLTEFVVQVHESDKQLFDSLIECDFLSATNHMVMNEAEAEVVEEKSNEVKNNKIKEKISLVLEKLKQFLVKACQQFIYKVNDIIKADKKIYEAYKSVLTVDNLKGFKGIAGYSYPAAVSGAALVAKFKDASNSFSSKIHSANSKDAIDTALSDFETKTKTLSDQTNAEISFGFNDKVDYFVPNAEQIKEALGVVNNASAIISRIKDITKKCIAEVKSLESLAKSISKSKEQKSEVETYKAVKLNSMISGSAKSLSSLFTAYTRTATKQIAAYRKLVIICGRYAAKKARGEDPEKETKATGESTMDWLLGEASDMFVFEQFAY